MDPDGVVVLELAPEQRVAVPHRKQGVAGERQGVDGHVAGLSVDGNGEMGFFRRGHAPGQTGQEREPLGFQFAFRCREFLARGRRKVVGGEILEPGFPEPG